MKEIDLEGIQKVQISILDYFDTFCRLHHLKYSLACGTLLGAVRHKGYIPWDDDIDVQMLRSDYERFIDLFRKSNHEFYELFSLETNKAYATPFAKLADNRTILNEPRNTLQIGINIDIFPIDYANSLRARDDRNIRKVKLFRRLWIIKSLKNTPSRSILDNVILTLLKGLVCSTSSRILAEKIDCIAKAQQPDRFLFEIVDGSHYKYTFPAQAFESCISLEFEGKQYFALKGFDEYLRACFGNYMQMPPESERKSSHRYCAYLKD